MCVYIIYFFFCVYMYRTFKYLLSYALIILIFSDFFFIQKSVNVCVCCVCVYLCKTFAILSLIQN